VCSAIEILGRELLGRDLEGMMAEFGDTSSTFADHLQMSWLGPHKGVVHLALASLTNACFDAWAKAHQQPLWSLLLGLSPESSADLLDLSYLEDVLDRKWAIELLRAEQPHRAERAAILKSGYPGYDTSVGWFGYSHQQFRDGIQRSMDQGFHAIKLKVGGILHEDMERASLLREVAGADATIMLDANQRWSYPEAVSACMSLGRSIHSGSRNPRILTTLMRIAAIIAPLRLAAGEHIPNRVAFKGYLQAGCISFLQPDCTRLGGVSEFLAVSLLARKFKVPVVPHVGDMGQIHQHLVLVNHIATGHDMIFRENIPHLRNYFLHPVDISAGHYRTPQTPGSSSDMIGL
jgi:L-fuconate dehydratase